MVAVACFLPGQAKDLSAPPRMSHRFVNSFRAGPGWNLVLLESCLHTRMKYTISECTVNKLLMMDRGTVRNMYIFMPK